MSDQKSPAKGMSQAHRIVRATFVTEESVYGVLLVSGRPRANSSISR